MLPPKPGVTEEGCSAPEPAAAGVPAPEPAALWLAVKTKPRQEERARDNLEKQGFTVYLPRLGVSRRRRDQWQTVVEPLFAGYLFLHVNPLRVSLAPVRSTLGVSGLVRFGQQLVPVPAPVIEFLQARERRLAEADKGAPPFSPGDRVEVLDGPFAGLAAVFKMTKGQDRALLLITLLGRCNTVSVPLRQLAPIS